MAEADGPNRRSSSSSSSSRDDGGDWRPIPDPTLLTTQQLMSAISALKELVFTRLDAMDRAVILLSENVNRVPTETDKAVSHLKELHDEKFQAIQVQFTERDVRADQTTRNNATSLAAALQAAKEAVGKQNESFALSIAKSEASTMKQMEQQGQLIKTSNDALESKISDLKDRVTTIESKGVGVQVAEKKQETASNAILSILGIVIAVGSLATLVIVSILK